MNKLVTIGDPDSIKGVMQPVDTRRRCGFCGQPMTAIELWHGCGELRLQVGMMVLAQHNRFRADAKSVLLTSTSAFAMARR